MDPSPTWVRPARAALWVSLALIVYGSLYPFHFSRPEALPEWTAMATMSHQRVSLADMFGNLGLFVPVGLFAGLAFGTAWRVIIVIVAGATGIAGMLQLVQFTVPGRTPDLMDVGWNMAGTAIGIALAWGVRRLGARPHRPAAFEHPLPLALLALYAFGEWVPLVPSLDLGQLRDALKPLLSESEFAVSAALWHGARLLAVGFVLAQVLRRERVLPALCMLALILCAGKIVIVGQVVDRPLLIGMLAGCVSWPLLAARSQSTQRIAIAAALLAAYSVAALTPFAPTAFGQPFNWLPFADLLQGSLLSNLQAIVPRLFVFSVLLWLATPGILAAATMLACWVGLLEMAQIWLEGRTASITEVILVLSVGWLLSRTEAGTRMMPGAAIPGAPVAESALPRAAARPRALTWPAFLFRLALAASLLALPLWLLVRLPGVPYNVRELLVGDGALAACYALALALLWFGVGAVVLADRLQVGPLSWLRLPAWAFGISVISLCLMRLGATAESIADVAGSNNLFFFVTQRDLWGAWWRGVFKFLGPGTIAVLERPVRYVALFSPVFVLLAVWLSALEKQALRWRTAGYLLLCALPYLWLCQLIAFDWSSTDNLNELIARSGAWGIGGGVYLYGLLIVLSGSAAALAHARGQRRWWAIAAVMLAVPLAWWLTHQGLESAVYKYQLRYSALQFLLGPDRNSPLEPWALGLRWLGVYSGAIGVLTVGMHLGIRLVNSRDVSAAKISTPAPAR